jgi:hypothetical protein
MSDHDYEAGLRDGKIEALERVAREHDDRLEKHDARIRTQERVTWIITGIILFLQTWSSIDNFLNH